MLLPHVNTDNRNGRFFGLTKPYEMSVLLVSDEDEVLIALLLLPTRSLYGIPESNSTSVVLTEP